MARARSIKPGFFLNEELAELPFGARLLFAGLWTIADRDGRMEDRPKRIKGQIFPFDSVDVEKLLQLLATAKFIIRYSVDGVGFIAIPSWHKHQHPHIKEGPSTIPAPCEHGASTGNSGAGPSSSLTPCNLDTPPIVPRSGDVAEFSLSVVAPPKPKPIRKRRGEVELVAWKLAKFEEFWDCVWAKIGKEPAKAAWDVACASPEVADRIIAACKSAAPRELAKGQRNSGSYLHPSTWLNQKRYDDEGPPEVQVEAATSDRFKAPYQIVPPTGGYNPADHYRPLPDYADWQSEEEPDGAA